MERLVPEIIIGLIILAFIIFQFIGMWKTFEKGKYPGIFCLIPFYNIYVMLRIGGLNPWTLLLFLVPGVNAFMLFVIHFNIARRFQFKIASSVTLSVLHWLILYPLIGFGNAVYVDVNEGL